MSLLDLKLRFDFCSACYRGKVFQFFQGLQWVHLLSLNFSVCETPFGAPLTLDPLPQLK